MALDKPQIIKKIYVPATSSLIASDSGAATAPQPSHGLSEIQVWKRIFNAATSKIRLVKV